jgi:putative spermidine/putrescine transport system permease protein
MAAVISDPHRTSAGPHERRPRLRLGRALVLILAVIYFVGPLSAAFWFSIDEGNGVDFHAYTGILSAPGFATAAALSLELAALTVVFAIALMIPTMLLVHLRFPRARPMVEMLSLLPLVMPPIVLVVGVGRVIGWGTNGSTTSLRCEFFNQLVNSHPPLFLALEYVILVLPFTYRSLDAGLRASSIGMLVEAARNLGASWIAVVWRVVLPTLRTSVVNAGLIAFALVLGEFTMAGLLQKVPFAVWLLQFQDTDGQLTVGLSLISLLLTWVLLIVLTALAGRTPRRARR